MTPLAFLNKVTNGTQLNHLVRDVCIEAMQGYWQHKHGIQKYAYERQIAKLKEQIESLEFQLGAKKIKKSDTNYGKVNKPRRIPNIRERGNNY
jgi:hypothetical protein